MMQVPQTLSYRIVVEGVIDRVWHECLGGLEITEERQPGRPVVTQLEGRLVDQSALQGVIDTLFMLGLRLMYVEQLPTNTMLDAATQSGGDTEHRRETEGVQEKKQ
jgi:hypothetical protein